MALASARHVNPHGNAAFNALLRKTVRFYLSYNTNYHCMSKTGQKKNIVQDVIPPKRSIRNIELPTRNRRAHLA